MVGTAAGMLWATSENLGVARLTADFVAEVADSAYELEPPTPGAPGVLM